jgi:hypothetical protein
VTWPPLALLQASIMIPKAIAVIHVVFVENIRDTIGSLTPLMNGCT